VRQIKAALSFVIAKTPKVIDVRELGNRLLHLLSTFFPLLGCQLRLSGTLTLSLALPLPLPPLASWLTTAGAASRLTAAPAHHLSHILGTEAEHEYAMSIAIDEESGL